MFNFYESDNSSDGSDWSEKDYYSCKDEKYCERFWNACERGNIKEARASYREMPDLNINYLSQSDWDDRETPLIVASRNGHTEIVNMLLEIGADVARPSMADTLPIHAATQHPAILKKLIQAGSPIDVKDGADNTPIVIAACNGDVEAAKILLRAKCDPNIKGDGKLTAVEVAEKYGHPEIVALINQHFEDQKNGITVGEREAETSCSDPVHKTVQEGAKTKKKGKGKKRGSSAKDVFDEHADKPKRSRDGKKD